MKIVKKSLVIISVILIACQFNLFAADPVEGYWKSIDDETGKVTAYWNLTVRSGKLYGYIVSSPTSNSSTVCSKCKGSFKNKPILGTAWIYLKKKGSDGKWKDGYVINSKNGKKYNATVWMERGKLILRGSIGPFGKEQKWMRISKQQAEAGF